jgi:hypothetical protein
LLQIGRRAAADLADQPVDLVHDLPARALGDPGLDLLEAAVAAVVVVQGDAFGKRCKAFGDQRLDLIEAFFGRR